jgi:hypothetical protein
VRTQIIQLNPHDDDLSVRDKLTWSQSERVLLVWPEDAVVLDRLLDLKLVHHHAVALGSQLALVTKDPQARFNARAIGIPVFDSVNNAQQEHWNMYPARKLAGNHHQRSADLLNMRTYAHPQVPAWTEHFITRLICLSVSLVAILALGVVILPGAKITFTPQVEMQSIQLDLVADPSTTYAGQSSGILPTYRQEVIIEGRDTISASARTRIPNEYAVGDVKITNVSTETITIPVGTFVATPGSDPVRFITTSPRNVIVDGNKTVIVPVRAINPGISGNLPANRLTMIEIDAGLSLTVSNPNATHGGTDATVPSPSVNDLQTLRQRLESRLEQDALALIQSYLPEGDQLISQTMMFRQKLEETQVPSINKPGDQLELFLRIKFECQVISLGMLRNILSSHLDERLPAGYTTIPGALEIAPLKAPLQDEDGFLHYTIMAKRELKAGIEANQVIGQITGLTIAKAKDLLSESFPLAGPADIKLSPSWWPRLPFTPLRIGLSVTENP